jgi:DNA-binding transcriptional ArsR family regulator
MPGQRREWTGESAAAALAAERGESFGKLWNKLTPAAAIALFAAARRNPDSGIRAETVLATFLAVMAEADPLRGRVTNAAISRLGAHVGLSRRSVQRALPVLESAGLVEIVRGDGANVSIRLISCEAFRTPQRIHNCCSGGVSGDATKATGRCSVATGESPGGVYGVATVVTPETPPHGSLKRSEAETESPVAAEVRPPGAPSLDIENRETARARARSNRSSKLTPSAPASPPPRPVDAGVHHLLSKAGIDDWWIRKHAYTCSESMIVGWLAEATRRGIANGEVKRLLKVRVINALDGSAEPTTGNGGSP